MRQGAAVVAGLVGLGFGLGPATAAVRQCADTVTSGPQAAATVAKAQRLAIETWMQQVRKAQGERFTSWRLSNTRSLVCRAAPTSGVVCEARANPCVIVQAPDTLPKLAPPEPKVIPILPRPGVRKPIDT